MALICFDGMNLRPKKSMLESSEKYQQLWGSWGAPFYCRESGSIWTHFFVDLSIFRSP